MRKEILAALLLTMPCEAAWGAEVFTLAPVTVTAERVGVDLREEPQAVTVVSEADFRRLGASNVSEALGTVLGLDLSKGSQNSTSAMGGHQVMLRGMNTNQTLILVDGRRLADEDTSQTKNMYLLSRMDLSQVERIEVLRGPAAAMYGSDAMGGVIQIITKKPGEASADYGFQAGSRENETHFRYDPGQMGRWSVAVHGRLTKVRPITFRNVDAAPNDRGIRYDGYDTPAYGNQESFGIDGIYDFKNENQNKLRVNLDYFHEKTTMRMADATGELSSIVTAAGMPASHTAFMKMIPPIVVQQNAVNRAERTEWSSALTYTGQTKRNDYEGRVYYSHLKKFSENINERPGGEAADLSALEKMGYGNMIPHIRQMITDQLDLRMPGYAADRGRYSLWGVEGRDTMSFKDHKFTFGGEFTKTTYRGTRLISQQTNPGDMAGHERYETAVYLSDLWHVNDKLYVTPSIRFAKGNQYGFVGTPKIGMTYRLDDHTRVKANWGKGFRAPTISELYLQMDTGHPVTVYGNPNLSPEKSKSYDLGFEWERGRTEYKISYFHNKVKNLIDTERESTWYHYVNRDEAKMEGIEASLTHPLNDRWTLSAGYTYLDAKDTKADTRLENRSRQTLTFALDYDDHKDYGFTGKIWDSFHGDYYFDGQDYTYHAVNLAVQKHWGKAYTLKAGLYNIGNKKVDDLYVNGREWYLGFERKW